MLPAEELPPWMNLAGSMVTKNSRRLRNWSRACLLIT
jgi:hypothetical protein